MAGNHISSLEPFLALMRLEDLNVSRNDVEDTNVRCCQRHCACACRKRRKCPSVLALSQDACALVGRLRFLRKLDCRENPCSTQPKFWERVVTASSSSLGARECMLVSCMCVVTARLIAACRAA